MIRPGLSEIRKRTVRRCAQHAPNELPPWLGRRRRRGRWCRFATGVIGARRVRLLLRAVGPVGVVITIYSDTNDVPIPIVHEAKVLTEQGCSAEAVEFPREG